MSKRVVVTGIGVVSPVGNSVPEFWASLTAGKSGIGGVTLFDPSALTTRIAGEVRNVDYGKFLDVKEIRRTDRSILHAMAATDEAVRDSGLDLNTIDKDRAGVIVASGVGGITSLEAEILKMAEKGPGRVSPFLVPMMLVDMSAGFISIKYGFKGPNYCVVSACASASNALGDALICMKAGMMDVTIAGGTEAAITKIGLAGFCSMKAMSTRNENPQKASSPFDKKRDGFVMGEGAGIIILETLEHALARNAKIYGEFVGYGATGDAHHMSAPAPEGEGAQRSMKMAMSMAGITPADIGYINAHGTSTPYNDKFESIAIAKVFGEHAQSVNISSTKSMTGHLLGASGAIEFIASILAIRDGLIPPTINYEDPDPDCPLNYTPNVAQKKSLTFAMSNTFGFGGHNATLIMKKYVHS